MKQKTASNRTPRRINRNLIFNLIRTRQPISRADLARVSGLQRSTVSLIVEDLISDGWVIEGEIGRLPRGRRPTYLELNKLRAVLVVDIHPNESTLAVTNLEGKILSQSRLEVTADAEKAIAEIVAAMKGAMHTYEGLSFVGVGICLPGRTNLDFTKLIFAPNLKWPVLELKSKMEKATGLRVKMDNVANACALSEVWFGDSDDQHDLVVVNVSEGLGTGIFANGQILRGDSGLAGEFGHVQLDANGPLCGCGNRGCWETLASNSAALRDYVARSGRPQPETFSDLLRRVDVGDVHAREALEAMAVQLGRGIRMIAVTLAPREIVIVGDITSAWELCGGIVEEQVKQHAFTTPPLIRPAYDGAAARLRSGVSLVLGEDPDWDDVEGD